MNRCKIVFAAVGFNLLFEYSMRGINNLIAQPALPLFLFLVYFPYFTVLEDLITKYRLKDYNLVIAVFFFGTAFSLFVSATQFVEPQTLGINNCHIRVLCSFPNTRPNANKRSQGKRNSCTHSNLMDINSRANHD